MVELRYEIAHPRLDPLPGRPGAEHEHSVFMRNFIKSGNVGETEKVLVISTVTAPADARARRARDDARLGIVPQEGECGVKLARNIDNPAASLPGELQPGFDRLVSCEVGGNRFFAEQPAGRRA